MTTAVASFIRCLKFILGTEVQAFTLQYVDLVVISSNFTEHLDHLNIIFAKFRSANMTFKLRKSTFALGSLTFLGHIISSKGVSINQNRVLSIQKFPLL